MPKILIACEESQTVCKAFRNRGFETYSCDIQKPSGGHPPCTYLSVTGNRWFNISKYGGKSGSTLQRP